MTLFVVQAVQLHQSSPGWKKNAKNKAAGAVAYLAAALVALHTSCGNNVSTNAIQLASLLPFRSVFESIVARFRPNDGQFD